MKDTEARPNIMDRVLASIPYSIARDANVCRRGTSELNPGFSYHVVSLPIPQTVVDHTTFVGCFGAVTTLALAALLIKWGRFYG